MNVMAWCVGRWRAMIFKILKILNIEYIQCVHIQIRRAWRELQKWRRDPSWKHPCAPDLGSRWSFHQTGSPLPTTCSIRSSLHYCLYINLQTLLPLALWTFHFHTKGIQCSYFLVISLFHASLKKKKLSSWLFFFFFFTSAIWSLDHSQGLSLCG